MRISNLVLSILNLAPAPPAAVPPFSGKMVVQLTAKSWIDGEAVIETTHRGKQVKLFPDKAPTSPGDVANAGGFKIHQRFMAEVKFDQGKITSAKFYEPSLLHRSGTTGATPGDVRVTEVRVDVSPDKTKATFVRTIEGNPSIYAVLVDPDSPSSLGLPPISNTLSVEITQDSIKPAWKGSAFPSHRFWMGGKELATQRQVPPSEFFKP